MSCRRSRDSFQVNQRLKRKKKKRIMLFAQDMRIAQLARVSLTLFKLIVNQ